MTIDEIVHSNLTNCQKAKLLDYEHKLNYSQIARLLGLSEQTTGNYKWNNYVEHKRTSASTNNGTSKVCARCKEVKSLEEFYRVGKYWGSYCKPCQGNYQRKLKYGLTKDEELAILEKQGRACAICFKPFNADRLYDVDHDHSDNHVRGLLCRYCNTRVQALEDPDWLMSARAYLGDSPPTN